MISSTNNERIKLARRVREGREAALLFVEGERLAEECLQSGLRIQLGLYAPQLSARAQIISAELARRGVPGVVVSEAVFASLSATVNGQGMILLAERPPTTLEALFADVVAPLPAGALWVGLDAVQDPGNVGTIIRTAEAASVRGVLAVKGCADVFAPKTLRSAMGSAFRLPLATNADDEAVRQLCEQRGLHMVAATMTGAVRYDEYDWRQPTLLWLGNEANGVSAARLAQCGVHLRIPLHPPVESLNVAAAAAVFLFEAAKKK